MGEVHIFQLKGIVNLSYNSKFIERPVRRIGTVTIIYIILDYISQSMVPSTLEQFMQGDNTMAITVITIQASI